MYVMDPRWLEGLGKAFSNFFSFISLLWNYSNSLWEPIIKDLPMRRLPFMKRMECVVAIDEAISACRLRYKRRIVRARSGREFRRLLVEEEEACVKVAEEEFSYFLVEYEK